MDMDARAARKLLREALETYTGMTSEDFSRGADRELRERVSRFLALEPAEYVLFVEPKPPGQYGDTIKFTAGGRRGA